MSPQRMRQTPSQRGYRIEISPQAWQQIGTMPSEVFNRIQRELEDVAAQTDKALADRAARPQVLEAGAYFAIYQVDAGARAVMLLEVTQEPPSRRAGGEPPPSPGSGSGKASRRKAS